MQETDGERWECLEGLGHAGWCSSRLTPLAASPLNEAAMSERCSSDLLDTYSNAIIETGKKGLSHLPALTVA